MDFADIVLVCYALGSVLGLLGLREEWRALRKPAAWAIAAGFAVQTGVVLRSFAHGGLEELSRGEFLQIMAWSLILVYCVTWWRLGFSILGLTAGPLALALSFSASAAGNIQGGLPESMTGAFFILHLAVLFLNFGLITLGFGSALYFLNLHRKLKSKALFSEPDPHTPALATVERINRLVVLLGFPLFTIGLLTGFGWAHVARGAFITADPKEIVSVLLWLLYCLVFVQRAVLGWKGRRAAVMLVVLFTATVVSLAGINFFMNSHHNFFQTPVF